MSNLTKFYATNSRAQAGLRDEKYVINWLIEMGWTVTPSSRYENQKQDVDCFVDGVPVSIKTQHKALETGNLCFELATLTRGTTREGTQILKLQTGTRKVLYRVPKGEWKDSWLLTGEATHYVFYVGDTLYQIKKEQLIEYIDIYGFKRYTQLSPAIKADNVGHGHEDAVSGLISLVHLVSKGVAHVLSNKSESHYVEQCRIAARGSEGSSEA